MPTYEYLCQTCSHRFETWQKMIDEPLTTCPECGSYIRRVFYPAGVVFKGSGFYKTDYDKKGAVIGGTNDDGKKAESTDGGANSSNGESNAVDSKHTSDTGTNSNTGGATSSSNSSANTSKGESKSTASAATK
jgi:putative FmdB family regulatory protein